MTRKRWARLALALLVCSLAGIVLLVAWVDPFEIYHRSTLFIPPVTDGTQSYANAGIARTYEYDSIIIGSSMTENFRPSHLEALFGGRFVKLCVNGGSPYNHRLVMDLAFRTHDVRRVLYGVDIDSLTYFYSSPATEVPGYLYDDSLLSDVRYWFNKGVLTKYIPKALATFGQSDPDLRDTMYMWGERFTFGKDAVLPCINLTRGAVEQEEPAQEPRLSQQSNLNVEANYLPYVQAHPDTEFIFFFPPYSLARWYEFYAAGALGYHLNQKEALIDTLLAYDNVRIYDFQAELTWITDLSNYVDTVHYGAWINDAIAEAIAADDYRVRSLEDARANDAVLRERTQALALAGEWLY